MLTRTQRVIFVAFVLAALCSGQEGRRLTFDVISIRPSSAGAQDNRIQPLPGGQTYEARNMQVKQMFSFMYRIPLGQISGGPSWLDDARWDIEAKADRSYNLDDLHTMFQNLLVDEFKLKLRKEVKEVPIYALLVDRSGLKMTSNNSEQELKNPISSGKKSGTVIGTRVPISYLCWWLTQQTSRDDRPVIDKTGLKGFYDFTLSFLPELPPGYDVNKLPPGMADWPSLFTALKEQLGLRLEAQRGPAEIYVIEHAEKPSLN
jgi:uncharacterized protein (TIGR03435 family)